MAVRCVGGPRQYRPRPACVHRRDRGGDRCSGRHCHPRDSLPPAEAPRYAGGSVTRADAASLTEADRSPVTVATARELHREILAAAPGAHPRRATAAPRAPAHGTRAGLRQLQLLCHRVRTDGAPVGQPRLAGGGSTRREPLLHPRRRPAGSPSPAPGIRQPDAVRQAPAGGRRGRAGGGGAPRRRHRTVSGSVPRARRATTDHSIRVSEAASATIGSPGTQRRVDGRVPRMAPGRPPC